MISMTGYGYCEEETEKLYLSVEIKSVNNRYLDIQINLPPFLNPLEPRLREFISSRVRRGRVEVYIRLRELEEELKVHLDQSVASEYAEILRRLAEQTGITEPLRLDHLLGMEGILKSTRSRDLERYWDAIQPLLSRAFNDFSLTRKKEGSATKQDILRHIEIIREALSGVEVLKDDLESYFTETVRGKFQEVVGDQVEESRVLTEIASLMVKYSINEELVRLKGHLKSFSSIAESEDAVGKKLDFLAQEIHREINTIGSKSVQYDISSGVVSMKDALENIREQLRNVE
ncbi:YicC family protein [Marispirochaeta aestuarii]|uniref:YicC family protein n=1 Tax=Marispirochaeta aestuarii TaxID=1963862 RepID=A0A1Y1RWC7_9SPIO|nr:YicC/YloC family endoribonuclease [Marispirochaeta aestuarii]ORC33873.1 YicC family protein [Marispirochaeta aestuarii]